MSGGGTHFTPKRGRWWTHPGLDVAAVAALCVFAEAVVAKNVLDVHLDIASQFAPFWVYLAWEAVGRSDPRATIAAMVASVAVTVAVLLAYAL